MASLHGWGKSLVAMVMVAGVASVAGAQTTNTLSQDEQRQFLLTAKVMSHKNIPKGVTQPIRMTLSDGHVTHDAAFSTVEERTAVMKFAGGRTELDFVDSYRFTIAAYRMAEILGLDNMMPVTVDRKLLGENGALSWWVDDVKFDEAERLKTKAEAPDQDSWKNQLSRMRVFTELVADTDRNAGNILITNEWKIWMIDFTRAFRHSRELMTPGQVSRCDRELLAKLRGLTKAETQSKTKPYLMGAEVDAMLARRDLIVERIDRMVAANGEAKVLY